MRCSVKVFTSNDPQELEQMIADTGKGYSQIQFAQYRTVLKGSDEVLYTAFVVFQ